MLDRCPQARAGSIIPACSHLGHSEPAARPAPGAERAVRPLVAAPVGGAPGPLRDARPAGLGAAVPGGDHLGVLVPAQRGVRARAGGGQARHRGRAAADAPAPDREPGAADAHRARDRRPARSTATSFLVQAAGFTRERPEITQPDLGRAPTRKRIAGYSAHELPARDRHQRRRHAGVAAGRGLGRARPRTRSARARDLRQTGLLAAVRRQLRQPGVPGADPAGRPRRASPAR